MTTTPVPATAVPGATPTTASAPAPSAGRRGWFALAVLMLPVLLVSVDNTVLSFALPEISRHFGTSGTMLLWIVDSYPLVLAGLLVVMGSFGDRFGRRRLLIIGAVGFALFSVAAAFAPTAGFLLASRVGLGVFGAMLGPSTLSLIRNIFADRNQRRIAIAVWAAGFSSGAALGPLLGGVLLENFWWGSVFLLAVPVLVLMLALTPFLVPESKDPAPGRIDYLSIVLTVATMLPIVYGIKNLATEGSLLVSATAAFVGLAAGTMFVARQLHRPDPMLDVRLFTVRAFSGAVLVNLLAIFSLVGFLFFVSQHLQLVLGLGPLDAGFVLLPGFMVTIVAGLAVVPVVRHLAPHVVVSASLLFSAAAYAMIALHDDGGSAGFLMLAFVILGLGVGASETISNDLILSTVPAAKAGAASAISETAYEVGAVLGTAVLGSILLAAYQQRLVLPGGLSDAQIELSTETLGGAVEVATQLGPAGASFLQDSAFHAFDSGVTITTGIAALLMISASVLAAWSLRGSDSAASTPVAERELSTDENKR
ncbi:MFS transporter [Arthrobacter echini]|uniref:MFS transporter n=1 Tax=Arthrobacter echini TaxID=1529066 RepID=A0A4S5EA82_9MICC|nr:MFS transporter [Arthrobacter echini]THJ68641.1 MFS transporter [Arthrobacter echini]